MTRIVEKDNLQAAKFNIFHEKFKFLMISVGLADSSDHVLILSDIAYLDILIHCCFPRSVLVVKQKMTLDPNELPNLEYSP